MTHASLDKKKVLFIVNPKSGNKDKKKTLRVIQDRLTDLCLDSEIRFTEKPKHATTLAKQGAQSYDLVVAVGGDGTVQEVGEGLVGGNTPMGIIPIGSGNGLARHLKIPLEVSKAMDLIQKFHLSTVDTVRANERIFIATAGFAFDAVIAKSFASSKKRGFLSYAQLALQNYFKYISEPISIEIEGKVHRTSGLLISFANGSQYGNDFVIAPQAKIDDGYMDLIVLQKPPFYSLPRLFMHVLSGKISSSQYYETLRCKEALVRKTNFWAHMDGEPVFFKDELQLQVRPSSLTIVTPSAL